MKWNINEKMLEFKGILNICKTCKSAYEEIALYTIYNKEDIKITKYL